MVKFAHSCHRLVQRTLTYPAALVAHYGHIGVGRFVDLGMGGGGGGGGGISGPELSAQEFSGRVPLREVCRCVVR